MPVFAKKGKRTLASSLSGVSRSVGGSAFSTKDAHRSKAAMRGMI